MCHRRWQTMHNRWWSDSATCGERIPHYHSASKMSNNVVPLRGTLLLEPPLRRLRPCGLASGYAWFAISDGTSSRRSPLQNRITSPTDAHCTHNRGAVADSANEGNSRPSDAFLWASIFRGLRFAHPRLSPFGFRLRGHAFQATGQRGAVVGEFVASGVLPYALFT